MTDYRDVDVQVHKAVDPSDAVPLQQLEALVSSALRYKGTKAITDTPPAKPAQGDVYIFSNSGALTHDWLPIKKGQTVTLHEAVFFDGTNWDLLGSVTTGGTSVHDVRGTAPISVDSTDAARPVVSVNLPVATDAVQGIVELATVDEAKSGTDTQRAVTPAGLEAKVAALKVEVEGANGIQVTGNINNPVVGLPNGAIDQVLAFNGTSWAPANANVISSNTTDIYEHVNVTETGDAKPGEVLTFIPAPGDPAGGVWSNKAPAAQALDDLSDVDLTINPPLKAGQVLMYEGTGAGLSKWVNVEMAIEDLVDVNNSVTKLGDVLICNSVADANNIAGWEHRSLEITDLNNVNLSPDWDKLNTDTGNVQLRDWMLAFNRQTGKWYNRNLPLEVGVLDSTRLPDHLKALPFYTLEYLQDYNHYIKVDAVFTPHVDSKQNHLFFEMVTQGGGQVDMTKWGIPDGGHALTTIVDPSGAVTQERVDSADMISSHFIAASVMICTIPYKDGLQPKKGNPIDLKMSLHFMKGRTAMKIETEYTSSNNSVVNQKFVLQSDQVDLLTKKLWRLNWNFVLDSHVPGTDPQNVVVSAFSEFA